MKRRGAQDYSETRPEIGRSRKKRKQHTMIGPEMETNKRETTANTGFLVGTKMKKGSNNSPME